MERAMAFRLDAGEIIDLGTQIASSGAIRPLEVDTDQLFEYVIAVAILIYDMYPM